VGWLFGNDNLNTGETHFVKFEAFSFYLFLPRERFSASTHCCHPTFNNPSVRWSAPSGQFKSMHHFANGETPVQKANHSPRVFADTA
jgi:hypothetical protein